VFHQYTIRSQKRDELASFLNQKEIGTGIHYPIPIHKQPLYQELGYADVLPESEKASLEVLSLPVHPQLSESEIDIIIDSVKEWSDEK
jgi:dTDP-4-amino-4,6-dideoxygalactose transaminase